MSSPSKIAIIVAMNVVPSKIDSGPWMLDPAITYLNHGSFGARTVEIFEDQIEYKRIFEQSPIDFLDRNRDFIESAREIVAGFVGADVQGFGFVENATTGVGCVIRSLKLKAGDEVLTTNHVYNGVRQLLKQYCNLESLLYREVDIPLPIHSTDEILQYIEDAISNKTKLFIVDHVASASSIVFPIKKIIHICRKKGILVLVDGAHAPGMLDLRINNLGPDWYVGNLHKWVCAPIGSAFVWTNEDYRQSTHPMTVSHWLHEGYTAEFDWQGTRDVSAWLTAADAVEVGERIGWEKIRMHNHKLVMWMQETIVQQWNVEPLSPLDGSMLGSMATILLPKEYPQVLEECIKLQDELFCKYALEVPIFEFQGKGMIRVSAQLYSKIEDIECLLRGIKQMHFPK